MKKTNNRRVKGRFAVRRWLAVALAGLALAGGAWGAGSNAPPAAATNAAPRDYGTGFAKFFALGLPDVQGAKYVHVSSEMSDLGEMRTRQLKLEGNAWLWEAASNQPARVVISRTKLRELVDPKKLMEEMSAAAKQNKGGGPRVFPAPGDRRVGGTWKPADAQKDCATLLAYLQRTSTNEEDISRYELMELYAPLFLSAAQFHRAGLTNEANRLAQALFDRAGDSRKVILPAMNHLADGQYEDLFAEFTARRDWRAYAAGLQALLQRFPAGWNQAPAVRRLWTRVKARAEQAAPPSVTGAGLTEADQKLAADLAQAAVSSSALQYLRYDRSLWVLPSGRDSRRHFGMGDVPILKRLTQRGLHSVPLLLALVKDDFLICADRGESGFHVSSFSSMRELAAPSEEEIEQMYQRMARPVTRGEVARALLQQVLPRSEDSSREEMDSDTLLEEAQRWYQEAGKQKPEELAAWYLEHGDESQQALAVNHLLASGATTNFARVEAFLLAHAGEHAQLVLNSASEYVRQRGRAALPFLQKLETAALAPSKKRGAADEDNEIQRDSRMDKAVREALAEMRKLAEAPPPEEILAAVQQQPNQWAQYENVLGQQLRAPPTDKLLGRLLDTAVAMPDTKVRRDLLMLVWSPLSRLGRGSGGAGAAEDEEEENEEPAGAEPAVPAPLKDFMQRHAAAWQALLADERAVPSAGGTFEATTFADHTAQMFERIFYREAEGGRPPAGLWDDMRTALIKARARARLAGQPLPAWPDAGRVAPARRAELAARLAAADAAGLAAAVAGLTDDEKLALSEETAKRADLQKTLRPLLFSVQNVQAGSVTGALTRTALGLAGRPLTKAGVDQLIAACRELAGAGQLAEIRLWRGTGLGGFRVLVKEYDGQSPEFRQWQERVAEELEREQPAGVTAALYAHESQAQGQWLVNAPAGAAAAKADSGGADVLDDMLDELKTDTHNWREESQKKFATQLEEFFKESSPATGRAVLEVQARPVIKAAKPAAGKKSAAPEPPPPALPPPGPPPAPSPPP